MSPRDKLHRLVDQVPEADVHAAEVFLEFLRQRQDPVRAAFEAAPEDDEPLSAEDVASLDEAKADIAAGRFITAEDAKRRLLG
ncbi:MAG: hypothetical protein FJZ01_26980 [Candidatus Sericytochromatia bacterium]|nr:hypothetical protein [Candidatus Tanganyikabacteria bacterium]